MLKNILFIQPFQFEKEKLSNEILIWAVYLENYLKSKIDGLSFDLLYLPIEKDVGSIFIDSYKEKDAFYNQFDKLILDLNFEVNENTLVCISGTTSHHFIPSKLIAEYFRDIYPLAVIVFGGAHASACPHDFKYTNSPVDYIIQGEGELELYMLIKRGIKKQRVPITLGGNCIYNLDDLPIIDFTIFDKYIKNFKSLNIILSRGCAFNCNFCIEKNLSKLYMNRKRWRSYSPKRAIQEVQIMMEYGYANNISLFGYYDPIFGMQKSWLNKFLTLYNASNDAVNIVETRFDVLNEELIKLLYKNNFFSMYGLENYSKTLLSIMNKTTDPKTYLEKFERIIDIHKKLEYTCMLNILCNFPGETEETSNENLSKLKQMIQEDKNNIFDLNLRLFHNFPGNWVYNNMDYFKERYGSIFYIPQWWKDETIMRAAPYIIKPSKTLSFLDSLNNYITSYKEIQEIKIQNCKENKPRGYFQNIIKLKNSITILDNLHSDLSNFFKNRFYQKENEKRINIGDCS
ncbi:MAG: B12-binding domain-containing radical SAM protein [Promethearchaeota archaeon]